MYWFLTTGIRWFDAEGDMSGVGGGGDGAMTAAV